MPLPSLPVELWMYIVALEHFSRSDYLSLALVSQDLNHLSTPLLYADLTIAINTQLPQYTVSSTSKFNLAGSRQQRLIELLESSERHRNYLHHIQIKHWPPPRWNGRTLQWFRQLNFDILELLQECPRLQSVYFRDGILNTEGIARLATRPTRGLSISLEECDIEGEVPQNVPFTITSLGCSTKNITLLYPLIFGGSLEYFRANGPPWGALPRAQRLLTFEPSLTSLTKVTFSYTDKDVIEFFRLTPNIVSLTIGWSHDPCSSPCGDEWGEVLPKLQSFNGPGCMLPRLLWRRPVTSLWSWDGKIVGHPEVDLSTAGTNFGSGASIREIHWKRSFDLETLVRYIVANCSAVEELRLSGLKSSHGQNHTLGLLNEMKKLKLLSLLQINYRTLDGLEQPVESDLEWERSQCEALRAEGCSYITCIAFPSGSWWRRHPDDENWKTDLRVVKA